MHECKHEGEVAVLAEIVPRIEQKIDALIVVMNGNGEMGIKAETKVNTDNVRRLWKWMGVVSFGLFSWAIATIVK